MRRFPWLNPFAAMRRVKSLRSAFKVERARYESFGGILSIDKPSCLIFVDRDYMRSLGYDESPLWERKSTCLSAPIEAHFAITNRCRQGCPHCYQSSRSEVEGELGFESAAHVLRKLAEMGVFHIALGGGESLEVEWLVPLAKEARKLGLVPNLTTNGFLVDEQFARASAVFGQINVSLDGPEEIHALTRGKGKYQRIIEAIRLLQKHHSKIGLNCVVHRYNFEFMESLFKLAKSINIREIELLRFKPAGRGEKHYQDWRLTPQQAIDFFPRISVLTRKYRLNIKLDCSFTPFICYHKPERTLLEQFAILGCEGGNYLIGITAQGQVTACSFDRDYRGDVDMLCRQWSTNPCFAEYRDWVAKAPEPCRSCDYLAICKGGCRIVAQAVTGSKMNADPECPLMQSIP